MARRRRNVLPWLPWWTTRARSASTADCPVPGDAPEPWCPVLPPQRVGFDLSAAGRMAALFELDTLPEVERRTHHEVGEPGEVRLMRAVLQDALVVATGRGYRQARDEARRWIAAGDLTDPFGFVPICHVLGLEPSAVRRMVATPGYRFCPPRHDAESGRTSMPAPTPSRSTPAVEPRVPERQRDP